MVPSDLRTYYRVQAATAQTVASALGGLWKQGMGSDFDAGWARIRRQAVAVTVVGQVRAAAAPQQFTAKLLADAGRKPKALATVPPVAFAGITPTGADLGGVLDSSVIVAKVGMAAGLSQEQSLARGAARLALIGGSQVQDAGRGSMQASMYLEPQIYGYVRYVSATACDRCMILAGKFFKFNDGFERHPRCDCVHYPVFDNGQNADLVQDPDEMFSGLSEDEQDAAFGKTNAQAIRDGADMNQVVNARSGMQAAGDTYTTAGTSKRAKFGADSGGAPRLSPQGCAKVAGDDREKYLSLLGEHGYL